MKGEIRGMKAGKFWSEDDSSFITIKKNDYGVMIEIADLEADVFYEFTVDEEGKTNFTWGQVSQSHEE